MSIQLTQAQEQMIHNKLQTGHYSSAEEVLEIALQLLDQYESGEADWLENVRDKIDAAYETTVPPVAGEVLVEHLRKRKISDFRGMAKYPMLGEDAQEWVSRTRREGDVARLSGLRGDGCD